MTGHSHHTYCHLLATGRNALGIGTAAFGAGAVMGHIDLQGVKRLAIGRAANLLVKVHILGPAKDQTAFIAGGIEMDTDAALRVDPLTTPILTVTGEDQNMVPTGTSIIHQKAKVTGQQLRLVDGIGVVPLTIGACLQADT